MASSYAAHRAVLTAFFDELHWSSEVFALRHKFLVHSVDDTTIIEEFRMSTCKPSVGDVSYPFAIGVMLNRMIHFFDQLFSLASKQHANMLILA